MKGFVHESTHNESNEWYTPKPIFDLLGIEFDLDPASPGANKIPWIPAKRHLTIEHDGLYAPWSGNVWLNPPYGNYTSIWLQKLAAYGSGVALVFARTDTDWFHRYAVLANAMCFLKGRILFVPSSKAAEYAAGNWNPSKDTWISPKTGKETKLSSGAGSLLLAYGEHNAQQFERLREYGCVIRKRWWSPCRIRK